MDGYMDGEMQHLWTHKHLEPLMWVWLMLHKTLVLAMNILTHHLYIHELSTHFSYGKEDINAMNIPRLMHH